uniref:Uncharacterized protein n=1 Tax=Theileria annulata TaxID=5874 RepID=A0A3B0MVQ6_THEAN
MHFRFIKNAVGLILYTSLYSSFSTSLFCSAAKTYYGDIKESNNSYSQNKDMFNLGTFNDNKFLSGELTLVKSQLNSDVTYKLLVGSQITTGSCWFVADIYAGSEYKFTNNNYNDLKMMLTTDYKTHLVKNGLVKHNFKVDPFKESEDIVPPMEGMVGYPERMYTFLTVSKDIKPGDYVVLFAYGRSFSDDLPSRFKEFRVKVL